MAMFTEVAGGVGTLSELYWSSRRVLLKTRDGLEKLEHFEYTSSSSEFYFAPKWNVFGIPYLLNLNVISGKRLNMNSGIHRRKHNFHKPMKVELMADSLKDSVDKYNLRHRRRMQEVRERTELLGRVSADSSHVLRIFDDKAQAMQSARSSSRMLEETLATETGILSKYSEQRDRLKKAEKLYSLADGGLLPSHWANRWAMKDLWLLNLVMKQDNQMLALLFTLIKRTQRKALDVRNTVGISNSVIRLIEKRNRVDRWIKYAGMILTVIVLTFVWRWIR
uniref:Membrin n=1 Tax=Solanum lycopersicum TaxID=4081 RepID=A0A3Q7GIZ3_SOLLC